MKLEMSNDEISKFLPENKTSFITYSSQLMNLANQYSQATRPANVGQLSELIHESPDETLKEWKKRYSKKYPDAIKTAAGKVYNMLQEFCKTIKELEPKDIEKWVEDLVIVKTYTGMKFQKAILDKLSRRLRKTYRLSTPEEESKGIDGYIGKNPVSIKPSTYRNMKRLKEEITVPIVYYTITKAGVIIEYLESAPKKKKAAANKTGMKTKTQKPKVSNPKGKKK